MKETHATDLDIQTFIFDQNECNQYIIDHIHACEDCKERVNTYQALSSFIKNERLPELEYDLSQLVIAQLPKKEVKEAKDSLLILSTIITSVILLLTTLILFKETISQLFAIKIMYGNSLLILSVAFIATIQTFDTIKSFYQKANMLKSEINSI